MGAWIETLVADSTHNYDVSHPVWVRGLKHKYKWFCSVGFVVAPRVGAWIETSPVYAHGNNCGVAPRVGAWIETLFSLKLLVKRSVAPRVGAWIETLPSKSQSF